MHRQVTRLLGSASRDCSLIDYFLVYRLDWLLLRDHLRDCTGNILLHHFSSTTSSNITWLLGTAPLVPPTLSLPLWYTQTFSISYFANPWTRHEDTLSVSVTLSQYHSYSCCKLSRYTLNTMELKYAIIYINIWHLLEMLRCGRTLLRHCLVV